MELPFMPFYYPATVPVQFDQSPDYRMMDTAFNTQVHPAGFYLQQPTYIPAVQPMTLTKPTPNNNDKNELRSSVFNQILNTFPELNNMIGNNNQPKKDPPTCLYDKPTTTKYSTRKPFETNLASDIMREEFDNYSSPSPAEQPFSATTPEPYEKVSDLLVQALSSVPVSCNRSRQKTTEPITCSVCQKTFSTKQNLKVHFQQHQENKRPHQCLYCGKRFTQRSTLRTHIRIHTGEKPYQCTYCPKSFADYSTFTKHSRIHTGERPYVCPVCGKGFAQSGNMIRHKEIHNVD